MSYGQRRYLETVFTETQLLTLNYADTLKLDFYSPKKDTAIRRPLILLVHGGGFAIGTRDNELERGFCEAMAGKGYTVASISYRLTRKGKSFGCDCPANEKIQTFQAATEDILKATKYLTDRATELGFDKEKIILAGSSAGAEAVLNTAFMRYHQDFRSLPYPDIKFAGVVSFAGAVVDAGYLQSENAVPALMFHGEKDNLVPYGQAPHHYCDTDATGYLILDGSEAIAEKLKELNCSYQLMYDPDGNHDWANLAYSYTDVIAEFIQRTILENQLIQSRIKLQPKNP
ncbi:alpha/beta hydrolase [Poritiphilus flavus]|nr:alpha/beta hydrolase [Poritiphilus flavus]